MEEETAKLITEDLRNRFTYHAPTGNQPEIYQAIRDAGYSMAALIRVLCPDVYETTLAVTKVEEAVMWANAAVAIHG